MTQCSSTGHDRCIRAGIRTALAGLLSCTDTGCRCHQSDCKNKSSDCANVHAGLLASLILTGFSIAVLSIVRQLTRILDDVERRHTLRSSRDPLRSRRKGGQRMLGAGVAVVDGNLEEPGAGHTTTGRRRSLVLLNPGRSAESGAGRGRQWWQWYWSPCPPGCNPVGTTYITRMADASPYIQENSL
jgi:hypothetical protein